MVFLAFVSVPLWIIFELYNKYAIHNWHYIGLPETLLAPLLRLRWAFATIWPAIFETGDWSPASATAARRPIAPSRRRGTRSGALGWLSIVAGALMLLVPIVYPSPWLAAPVLLGFHLPARSAQCA